VRQNDNPCITPAKLQAGVLIGTLVVLSGLGALACDFLRVPQPKILDVHWLFGAVLLAAVAWSLRKAWRSPEGFDAGRFYICARRLARWVYLLLYFMAAVRISLYLSGGPTLDDFQVYIGFGLLAVCLIRVCAMFRPEPGSISLRRRLPPPRPHHG
jgi:hypothetical protein